MITQPWFEDDWGQEVIQQKISKKYIDNEDDALLKYPTNLQGGYSLVNKESFNRWGIPRGYAIHPGYSPIHNVSKNSGFRDIIMNPPYTRLSSALSVF